MFKNTNMKIEELKNKKILILGLGNEGMSTLKFLRRTFPDKIIGIADEKTQKELGSNLQKIITKDNKLKLHLGRNYQDSFNLYEVIFRSPGIRLPKSTTAQITSQTKIVVEAYRDKIIGVTGTKGKTTTTSLIYKILKDAKLNVELVGNIGNPPLDYIDKVKNIKFFIFELSSFQLQDLQESPHIAVFLNLYEEHLDYHRGFENYKKAKGNIVRWQKKGDFVVYNNDSKLVREITGEVKSTKIPFSNEKKLDTGAFVKGDWVYYDGKKVLKTADTRLKGRFNLNNILAAVSVAKLLNIPNSKIASSVKSFQPVKHRLEYVGKFSGVDFYNDSIATIPEATIAALVTLSPNIDTLIVGGYNRGVDYSQLSKKIIEEKIPNIILFPQTGKIILDAILLQKKYSPNHFSVKNMKSAVKIAKQVTTKSKICLLSPASSSFNMFRDYQDRGKQFIKEVNNLK